MINNMFGATQPYGNAIGFVRAGIGYALNWVRLIGTGLALIMMTYLALRYITSAPEVKADLRKTSQAYFLGATIFLCATNIIYILVKLVQSVVYDVAF